MREGNQNRQENRSDEAFAIKIGRIPAALENQALAKANSPPKAAGTEPTPSTTTSTVTIGEASESKEKGRQAPKEKRK